MGSDAPQTRRWWIFDLPPRIDPLLILGLVLGLGGVIAVLTDRERYGGGALVFTVIVIVPSALLLVGTVLGAPREYLRGRRSGR